MTIMFIGNKFVFKLFNVWIVLKLDHLYI